MIIERPDNSTIKGRRMPSFLAVCDAVGDSELRFAV
nr:MAG TPA: hypothetical protein [Caudoviricetes sp.]